MAHTVQQQRRGDLVQLGQQQLVGSAKVLHELASGGVLRADGDDGVGVLDLRGQRLAHAAAIARAPAQPALLEQIRPHQVPQGRRGVHEGAGGCDPGSPQLAPERGRDGPGVRGDRQHHQHAPVLPGRRDLLDHRHGIEPHGAGDAVVVQHHGRVLQHALRIQHQAPQPVPVRGRVVAQRDQRSRRSVQQEVGRQRVAQHGIDRRDQGQGHRRAATRITRQGGGVGNAHAVRPSVRERGRAHD